MYWLDKRILPSSVIACADPALTISFRVWEEHRQSVTLPGRSLMDNPGFELIVPDLFWLNRCTIGEFEAVREQSMQGFNFDNLLNSLDLGPFEIYSSAILAQMSESTNPTCLGQTFIEDMMLVALAGIPIFQAYYLSEHSSRFVVQSLILPFSEDGMKVDNLAILVREGQLQLSGCKAEEIR